MDEFELVDDERLVFQLFNRDLPAHYTVAAELDVDSVDDLPFVSFSLNGGEQTGAGPGLWRSYLTVNAFQSGQDAAWEMCRELYRVVHTWGVPGASVVAGMGHVSSVDDVSKFSRTFASVLEGKQITQYTGSFTLLIRT